jgi:hypothetical protein
MSLNKNDFVLDSRFESDSSAKTSFDEICEFALGNSQVAKYSLFEDNISEE